MPVITIRKNTAAQFPKICSNCGCHTETTKLIEATSFIVIPLIFVTVTRLTSFGIRIPMCRKCINRAKIHMAISIIIQATTWIVASRLIYMAASDYINIQDAKGNHNIYLAAAATLAILGASIPTLRKIITQHGAIQHDDHTAIHVKCTTFSENTIIRVK